VALPVVNGATTMCTMGLAPGQLVVLPKNRTMIGGQPAANIMDNIPMMNVMPFMLCNSLANPITAAQTAAALGVLTPGTCIPVLPGPWVPGAPKTLVANMPAMTNSDKCMCAYGGQISILFGGVVTATVA
jgi:hypothetical protein